VSTTAVCISTNSVLRQYGNTCNESFTRSDYASIKPLDSTQYAPENHDEVQHGAPSMDSGSLSQ
jgi:hypothetical protein